MPCGEIEAHPVLHELGLRDEFRISVFEGAPLYKGADPADEELHPGESGGLPDPGPGLAERGLAEDLLAGEEGGFP